MDYGLEDECELIKEQLPIEQNSEDGVFVLSGSNNNYGIEDEDYCTTEETNVRHIPRYLEILNNVESAISFDISIHSTGIVKWTGKELKYCIIDVSEEINIKSKMSQDEIQEVFKEYVEMCIDDDKEYEFVAVEDVYGGESFLVTKSLMAMNPVPDRLVRLGKLKTNEIVRKDNKEWKRILRTLHHVEGCPTDKVEIESILRYLEFPIEELYKYNTSDKKNRYQDLLDALGLMIAVILEKKMNVKVSKKNKVVMSRYIVEWYESVEIFEAFYSDGCEYIYRECKKSIETTIRRVLENGDIDVPLVIDANTDNLGKFAIEYNLPLDVERICVVLIPKKKKTRKSKVKIIM